MILTSIHQASEVSPTNSPIHLFTNQSFKDHSKVIGGRCSAPLKILASCPPQTDQSTLYRYRRFLQFMVPGPLSLVLLSQKRDSSLVVSRTLTLTDLKAPAYQLQQQSWLPHQSHCVWVWSAEQSYHQTVSRFLLIVHQCGWSLIGRKWSIFMVFQFVRL